ncbi:MAG: response regulator [Anaerolineae bacterium]|nr:response regulator [Anaerolineae bacterium]
MIRIHNGSAVPRYQVFVLGDGAYVVQWTETSVQDILSGAYRQYQLQDFGHRITDSELEQLKSSGVIEDYDQAYVWVFALPEDNRFGEMRTAQMAPVHTRSYYINTTLPVDKLIDLQCCIDDLKLSETYCACTHEGLVAVLGKDAMPFNSLKDAENAHRTLCTQAQALFENSAIAFTESDTEFAEGEEVEEESIDLDALIASQSDTTVTRGKYAVVACRDNAERHAIMQLLGSMEMAVHGVATGQEALRLVEEEPVDVLVMDTRFDDMHGWAMLGRVREIDHADRTRVIALAEEGAQEQVFALTVARVDVYLHKPISMAHLRQSVWSTLKEHSSQ